MRWADADLRLPQDSLQHSCARRDELSDLHLRLGLRRPLGASPGEHQHHGRAHPCDRALEEPGSPGHRPVRLLGAGCGDEAVRHDAVRQSKDLAGPQARDGPHPAVHPDRDHHLGHRRDRDRRLFRVTPVLRIRLHGDDFKLRRFRDTGLLAGPDVAGARRPDLPEMEHTSVLYIRAVVG